MDLVLEDIEEEKLEVAVQAGDALAAGPVGETAAVAAAAAPRAQGRYLPLLQKDSLERVLGLICDVLDGAPGARLPPEPRDGPAAAVPIPVPAPLPQGPAEAAVGDTGEPGAAGSGDSSLLSCEQHAELVLAPSTSSSDEATVTIPAPDTDTDGSSSGSGEQPQAESSSGGSTSGGSTEESPEPAGEPTEAAGEPRAGWWHKAPSPDEAVQLAPARGCAAQHQLLLWPEPLDGGAVPALQLGQLLASLQPGERQQLETEVLRQPLFSRARRLFDSWLRSPDSAKAAAPAHEDVLKELVAAALHKASGTLPPTWAAGSTEHPRAPQPELQPSFLQRVMHKLGLKPLGRREAQKP